MHRDAARDRSSFPEVDLYQKSSMNYEYKDGFLTLPNMDPIAVTDYLSSFTISLAGGTSGESQGGVSGPNMVVANGINGTYTMTDCHRVSSAP